MGVAEGVGVKTGVNVARGVLVARGGREVGVGVSPPPHAVRSTSAATTNRYAPVLICNRCMCYIWERRDYRSGAHDCQRTDAKSNPRAPVPAFQCFPIFIMHILLVFCDGVGLGDDDPATNPFFHAPMKTLRALFGKIPTRADGILYGEHAILVPTDARLGVPGLPQSGTGQTTIFTGINAPAHIGEHLGPYPNDALRELLKQHSIFKQLGALGFSTAFGNAYPPFFFERLQRGKARRTATLQAAIAGDVRVRDVNHLARGEAVSGLSMNNKFWVESGASVPLITAHIAGENLMRLAQQFDFTAFEYAPTDMVGHKDNHADILGVLNEVDEFWGGIVAQMNLESDLVIITSDHGNIEDWTVKGHTLNPVPTILLGARRAEAAEKIRALTDIAPTVLDLLRDAGKFH